MNAKSNEVKKENSAQGYLDKNNPMFTAIKARAANDLKLSSERSNSESADNKLLMAQMENWNEEKRDQFYALFEKSINDYTAQTHFDVETFMMVFSEFGKMDLKQIADEYDLRIQSLSANKFAVEFWEDGLAVNSEAHAIKNAHELATSEYAKKHPDEGIGNVDEIRKNFANVRKSINDGEIARYTKVMALLYTKEKDGSINFNDPFQRSYDFLKK